MAQKTIVELTDDLTEGPADVTRHFTVDGVDYEIDLSTENSERLDEVMAEFVEAARKVRKDGMATRQRRAKATLASLGRDEKRARREWAKTHFPERNLGDRGRLPKDILDAYDAAHGGVGAVKSATAAEAAKDEPSLVGGVEAFPTFADAGV